MWFLLFQESEHKAHLDLLLSGACEKKIFKAQILCISQKRQNALLMGSTW